MEKIKYKLVVFFYLTIGLILAGYPSDYIFAVTTIGTNISTGGNLTVDGALKFTSGATNNYILSTDASGNAIWISVGTALGNSNTDSLPEGATNKYYSDTAVDARISAQKGVASGLATLDGAGKVPSGQLPSIALNNSYAVADIGARDALSPASGDVAIVADDGSGVSRSYVWDSIGSTWLELLTPLSLYLTKANNLSDLADVAIARSNLGLGNVTNDAQITKSIGTAKGDLIVYSASGTPTNLAVGTDGQFLIADSSSATGVKWTTSSSSIAWGGITGTVTDQTDLTDYITNLGYITSADLGDWNSKSYPTDATGVLTNNGSGTLSWSAPGAISETDPLAVLKSTYTTNGDLLYGTGVGTYTRLGAGSEGQVLTLAAGVPSWVNPADAGTMMLSGNSDNSAVNNTTRYFPIIGEQSAASADAQAGTRSLLSRAGTIKNLYVKLSAALASGKTGTVTVFKNGVATALSATLSVGPVNFSDTTHSFTVAAGDEVGIKVVTTGNVKFSWAADFTN